jgi:hypothetical protein
MSDTSMRPGANVENFPILGVPSKFGRFDILK